MRNLLIAKNKKYFLCMFFVIVLSLQFVACKKNATATDLKIISEIKAFRLPLYPLATNIKENYYKKYVIKNIKYKVDMYYPADKIIGFYDQEMKKISFFPFVEDYHKEYDRTWQTYVDGTMEGEPTVASLTTSWSDRNHTKRATIVMRYFYYNKESTEIYFNKNKELNIEFRIKPFAVEPPP